MLFMLWLGPSSDNAMCYVLPVLWKTPWLYIMGAYFAFAVMTGCLTALY